LVQRTNLGSWHAEESVEADRKDQHRQNVAIAQFGVEIAKRKPVWEKSRSAPDCAMRTKMNQAVLKQSVKIL
jgi:hypothetical protein